MYLGGYAGRWIAGEYAGFMEEGCSLPSLKNKN